MWGYNLLSLLVGPGAAPPLDDTRVASPRSPPGNASPRPSGPMSREGRSAVNLLCERRRCSCAALFHEAKRVSTAIVSRLPQPAAGRTNLDRADGRVEDQADDEAVQADDLAVFEQACQSARSECSEVDGPGTLRENEDENHDDEHL